MSSSEITCPNCSARVPAEHINIDAMAGKCERCDHFFPLPQYSANIEKPSIRDQWRDLSSDGPAKPKSLKIDSGPGGELYIRKSWFSPELFFLLFFCIAWDSFLVFWYSIAFGGDAPWIMIVFPIGHVAVGVGLTYAVIAGFLNKTHLFTDSFSLFVKHRPLPWFGNKEIDTSRIESIFVGEHAANNTVRSRVVANLEGSEVEIMKSLKEPEARFIAFQLAKKLRCDLESRY